MKNFRFLSSLALTGLLATNVFGTTFANTNIPTQPVGVYKKIVEGKAIVPFVFANRDDKVTIKDIKECGKFDNITSFKGKPIPSEDTIVGTGDVFKADGVEYTLVVYGDVNGDGKISMNDATVIQDYRAGEITLDDVQKVAANVVRGDGSAVTMNDATSLQEYQAREHDVIIDKLPDLEEEVIDSIYHVKLNVAYINSNNVGGTGVKATINLDKTLDKPTSVELVYNKVSLGTTTIPAHTDLVEITTISNLDKLPEGISSLKLVATESKDTLAIVKVEKHISKPTTINVSTERTGTLTATLSLTGFSKDGSVRKIYYNYAKYTQNVSVDTPNTQSTSIDLSNNQLVNAQILSNLDKDGAYIVKYIVEDQYGNFSEPQEAVIAKDGRDIKAEPSVDSTTIKVPTLDNGTNATKFTWSAPTAISTTNFGGYEVTLYKNGEIVEQKNTNQTEYPEDALLKLTSSSADISNAIKEPGKYKITVKVKGRKDGETTDSEKIAESKEIEITKLNAVSNLVVETNETNPNKVLVKWDSNYVANGNNANIEGYVVELATYNTETGEYGVYDTKTSTPTKEKQLQIDVTPNTLYSVRVIAKNKNNDLSKVSSDAVDEEFFTVDANANGLLSILHNDTLTNSITLHIDESKIQSFKGKNVSYSVEIFEPIGSSDEFVGSGYTRVGTRNITLDAKGNAVVDGLSTGKNYKFKLIVSVDNKTGKSTLTTDSETTKLVGTEIKNLTVVTKDSDKGANKILKTATGLNINGVEYKTPFTNYYPNAGLQEIYNIMLDQNVILEGDIITFTKGNDTTPDRLTLTLPNKASNRNFGTTKLANMVLELTGNNFSKELLGSVKELILSGDSIYDIKGMTITNGITLQNGVSVKVADARSVKVAANSIVTINGVKVSTIAETTLKVTAATENTDAIIVVTPNNGENNLTFESDKGMNITFAGDNTSFDSVQKGTITIKSKGGKVSLKGTNMSVDSKLDITAEGGEVEIIDPTLKGDKSLTVSGNTTIHVKAKTQSPYNLNGLVMKEYKFDDATDVQTLKTAGILTGNETQEEKAANVEKLNNYLASFGVNGINATIKVNAESDDVTITFDAQKTTNKSVSNIK